MWLSQAGHSAGHVEETAIDFISHNLCQIFLPSVKVINQRFLSVFDEKAKWLLRI